MPVLIETEHDAGYWIGTWGNSPCDIPDDTTIAEMNRYLPLPPVEIVTGTVRYRLRIAKGGHKLRLIFANPNAQDSLRITAASVGLAGEAFDAQSGTICNVTFGEASDILVAPAAPAWSDPVDLKVVDGADLVVSLYIPDGMRMWGFPLDKMNPAVVDMANQTEADSFAATRYIPARPVLARVDVLTTEPCKVVVALGDSITEGVGIGDDERGWPGTLARRLAAFNISVVNAGISGNRLTRAWQPMQAAALARLDSDVLSVPGISHIVLLEGINDIASAGNPSSADLSPIQVEDMIASFKQIIARAYARGINVIGGTILPFDGWLNYNPEGEQIRQAANHWIRTSGAFDAIIDFEEIARDPNAPGKLHSDFDSGDHLHLSAAGYRALGESIDLSLFK